MPRVVNGALAVFLAAFVAPVVSNLGDKRWYVQVVLLSMTALVLLFVVLCLASALRPGSLGRFARRHRRRRG